MEKLDVLSREEFVNRLITLTENVSNAKTSASFAINGVWGCGKSFVLDMYEEKLNEIQSEETATDKYFVIRYNCWKYDYYEEPLVAIVTAMIDIINEKTKIWKDETKKAHFLGVLTAVGTALLSTVNDGIKDKLGVDIKSTYQAVKTSVSAEKEKVENSHKYDIYFSFKQTLDRLKTLIAELSEEKTVVFIVDELDRCLPEYAIKVLERLHHLTEDLKNVLTVISIDKTQLEQSISKIFGFKDSGKYLEKFIQFEIELDNGIISDKMIEKYPEYTTLFDKNLLPFEDSVEEFLQTIFENIGIRKQEHLFKKARTIHQLLFTGTKDYSFMCMELLLIVLVCEYGHSVQEIENSVIGNSFADSFLVTDTEPKFAKFLNEKIQDVKFSCPFNSFSNATIYLLPKQRPSLYGMIIFYWYWLHNKSESFIIKCDKSVTYSHTENYITELKLFLQTIELIK